MTEVALLVAGFVTITVGKWFVEHRIGTMILAEARKILPH
jgi:hypothetical protein